ncbi:sialidase family protein [Streptomyces sp. NBC_01497]|uniref:sialidase family protein n=1 Tax=Streptomyces sp. NBC_01497 TaxID=2903885 RepID=UPI002E34A633|nr:sialidase family protein [Streptomyces sp. NBC_01497]
MARRTVVGFAGVALANLASAAPASAGSPASRRVTSDEFTAHVEPVVAVDPIDPRHLLAACRVFIGSRIGVATYHSDDGGLRWQALGLLPNLVPDACGNPTVGFDQEGRGYVCAVQATAASRQGDALVWRFDSARNRFAQPVTAVSGGDGLADHPSMVVAGRQPGAPATLHVVARLFGTAADGLVITRSDDGGQTFQETHTLPFTGPAASAPVLAVGESGTLCVLYTTPSPTGALAVCATTSHDRGATFQPAQTLVEIQETVPNLSPLSARSVPALAALDERGAFCAVTTAFDEATGVSRLMAIPFRGLNNRSQETAVDVATSSDTIYLQPQIASNNEHIAITVYALSLSTRLMDVLLFQAPAPRAATFDLRFRPPVGLTSTPFDPLQAVDTGDSPWLGNYQGLTTGPDQSFHPVWTDTRNGTAQIFTARQIPCH